MNSKTKQVGKVRSIPLTEIKEGMKVWHPKKYGVATVKKLRDPVEGIPMTTIKSGFCTVDVRNENLRQLVVEYEIENHNDFPSIIQLPLKWSQWAAAINNGEVDSDKEVIFETVIHVPDSDKMRFQIAKIIPEKKKLYTEEEMFLNMQYYMEYCIGINGYITPQDWIENHKHF